MAFSAGVYTLPGPALVTGEIVSATENNQLRNDMAASFNLTMLRNGTSTATANLPMGGFKLTGLGVATTSGDALSYGQAATVSSFAATGNATVGGTLGVTGDLTLTTNPILSGGTANGVAYLNGSKVLTTGSALTFDGTNLGVGGTASNGKIEAIGTSGNTYLAASTTSNTALFGSRPDISYTRLTSSSYLLDIATLSNQPILFTVNNSEQMRLTSTGLGIGTSSPGYQLALSKAGETYIEVKNTSSGVSSYFGSAAGGSWLGTTTNHPAYFYTNSTQKMVIDTSGNLGLGVTPSAWSSWKAIQVSPIASVASTGGYTVVGSNWYGDSGGDKYLTSNYASRYLQYNGMHQWQIAPSGTAGNPITFTQAMTLDASGNLTTTNAGGSQTSTITANATGTGTVSTVIASNNATALGIFGTTSNHALIGITNGSERMRIDPNGYVAIGNATTTGKFSVSGYPAGGAGAAPQIGLLDIGGASSNSRNWAIGNALGNANYGQLSFNVSTTVGGSPYLSTPFVFATDGYMVLKNGNLNAGGTGITFPATQSASSDANTLDDYEEGTWTPSINSQNQPIAYYVKIGRMVYVWGDVTTSFTGSATLNVYGLPFTVQTLQSAGVCSYTNWSSPIGLVFVTGQTRWDMYNLQQSAQNITSGTRLLFSGMYATST